MAIVNAVEVQSLGGVLLVPVDDRDILGHLVVHQSVRSADTWTVTHIATGLAVLSGLSSRDAAWLLAAELERAADWSKATSAGFPSGTLSARARRRISVLRRSMGAQATLPSAGFVL